MCLNTHLFDCVYILKVIFMGYTVWTFVSNLHKEGSCFNRYGKWFAFALPLGGLFDVLENIVSFFLTANPGFFSYWLVFTDSTLAVIKFVFLEIAAISKQMTKLSEHGLLDIYVNPANNRHNQIRLTDGCTRIVNDCTQVLDKLVKEH